MKFVLSDYSRLFAPGMDVDGQTSVLPCQNCDTDVLDVVYLCNPLDHSGVHEYMVEQWLQCVWEVSSTK